MEQPSGDLLRLSRSGDQQALQHLLDRHLPGLRAFARVRMSPLLRAHESGSDLVQSVCLELFEEIESFEFRGEEAFRSWLFTTLLNKLRNRERDVRAAKRDARLEVAWPESRDGSLAVCYSIALSPSQQLVDEERVRAFEAAFDALPESYREVISLSKIARLSRAEVAKTMGRSEDSVKNLLYRGLVALAEAVDRGRTSTAS